MTKNYTKPEITSMGYLFTSGEPRSGNRFAEIKRREIEEESRAREERERNTTRLAKLKRGAIATGKEGLYRFGEAVVWFGRMVRRVGSAIVDLGFVIEDWVIR